MSSLQDPALGAARWMDDAHALVVGIARYLYVPPLPPTWDAEDVAAALIDPALCAYPPANVQVLRDEEATGGRLFEELERLARVSTSSSTVLVYFSGHGGAMPAPARDSFLLPVDARAGSLEELVGSVLGGARLSQALSKIRAARLTVVLDCCSAFGAATVAIEDAGEPAAPGPLRAGALAELGRGRGRVVLAASSRHGASHVLPGQRNGLFTEALLAGLTGEAPGVGGVIRVCDLFDYVQRRVVAVHGGQRPMLSAELEENYPIALYRGGRAPEVALPPPPDALPYDAFVSFAASDKDWVMRVLVPDLEARGLRLCVAGRDYRPGRHHLRELSRAVTSSRYSVCVLSPAYLDGPFDTLAAELAIYWGTKARRAHVLPLVLHPCSPPLIIDMLHLLDISAEVAGGAAAAPRLRGSLSRLAMALREPAEL